MSARRLRALRRAGLGMLIHAAACAAAASDARVALPMRDIALANLAALRDQPERLLLRVGAIDPRVERIDFGAWPFAGRTDRRYGIVQFEPGATSSIRRALSERGIAIVGYLPNQAYLVRWPPDARASLTTLAGVRWSGAYEAGYKFAPALLDGSALACCAPSGPVELEIHGFPGERVEALVEAVRAAAPAAAIGARASSLDLPAFRVRVHPTQLAEFVTAVAAIDGVAFVEPHAAPRPANRDAIGPIQANAASCANPDASDRCPGGLDLARAPLWARGLLGSEQIVAVADTGLDRNESWFVGLDRGEGVVEAITMADDPPPLPPQTGTVHPDRKVYAYWVQPGASAYDNTLGCGGLPVPFHGSHVVGSVLGDAAPYAAPGVAHYADGEGMAPQAQVLFQDIGDDATGCLSIADIGATLAQAHAGGAGIHSDSWGGASNGYYGGYDLRADAALWSIQDLLMVVSAGNDGPDAATTGSPGNAKNTLTIGATRHGLSARVAAWSSRGPTVDGRRKPDLVAPGEAIVSAAGNLDDGDAVQAGTTRAMDGTSMATPIVAGGAALLRQYFGEGGYPLGRPTPHERIVPTGSLLKAALINGAAPITGSWGMWPDDSVGWGRIWVANSAYFQGDRRGLRLWVRDNGAGLATADTDEFALTVGAGDELRATLAWFDPEAAPLAAPALVNDLDLTVIGPYGHVYRGNHFGFDQSEPGGSADRLNTVEQVRLKTPAAGVYHVRVEAHAVPGNGRATSHRQGYALVVSGRLGANGDRLYADGFSDGDDPRHAAPATLGVIANDAAGVRLQAAPAAGAEAYQLYRADGSCADAPRERFRFAGVAETGTFADARSQGGQAYAYRVRAIRDGVESALSDACVEVVSQAACDRLPAFARDSLVADGLHASCAIDLAWQPATPRCPGETVDYRVWRADDASAAPTLLATVPAPTYTDLDVVDGRSYVYHVEAVTGGASLLSDPVAARPVGTATGAPGVWIEDADQPAGAVLQAPWTISQAASATGSRSYRSAAGAVYPPDACAALTTIALVVRPDTPRLHYRARWQIEADYDGVVVELSADGGASWTALTPDGGYPGSFAQTQEPPVNACGYPASQGAFNGESPGYAERTFVAVDHDLSAWAGQRVLLRWRLSSDGGAAGEGYFVDDIRLDALMPMACTAAP
ncbi:MAG: hypothetical protein DI564_10030 [Rhodanobacter denitrificans]|uniref:Peptidase S8/S53 domain-containing protein n=1 Tax=Rhodanobacter denitrificans TaxID=666685 RepID=A0A2W5KCI4_9GAMM|nr:MAG: hypothetical protein DI564_10030 [Rhodanobacter denitrificans]